METPLPFITKLGKDADQFADSLTLTALGTCAIMVVWALTHWMGLAGWPPKAVRLTAMTFCMFWFVFKALAALIDYAIFAVIRALSEFTAAALLAASQSIFQSAGESSPGASDRRDPAVAYLHDFIERSRQATHDVVPPNPPTAS